MSNTTQQLTKTPTTDPTKATRKSALVDISILGGVFWAVLLALQFTGVENIGSWTGLVRRLLEFGP